jgi:hypothetical protein
LISKANPRESMRSTFYHILIVKTESFENIRSVDAACNCGVAPVPIVKVQEHFQQNPDDDRSNRTIADELGVNERTVRRAKQSGAAGAAGDPDERPTIDKPPAGAPWDDQDDRDPEPLNPDVERAPVSVRGTLGKPDRSNKTQE